MKNRKPAKLRLHRETVLILEDSSLLAAHGAIGGGSLSIPVCTAAISDCVSCTKRLDTCPLQPPATTGTMA